ncbi:MAG: hypothetical protein ACOX7I_05520 [Oscillospiraceae bacterium]
MKNSENRLKSPIFALVLRIWTVHVFTVVIYLFILLILVPIFGDNTALFVASVVTPIAYLLLTYLDAWRAGERDHNLVLYGHIKWDRLKPAKAVLFSQLPGIFCSVLIISNVSHDYLNRFVRLFFMNMAYEIQLLSDSFRGIYLLPALLPFISVLPGYFLGYKGRRISDRLVYKQDKSGENKRK